MKKLSFFLLGLAASSVLIAVACVLRGVFIEDWSGYSPGYRFFWAPIFFGVGLLLAAPAYFLAKNRAWDTLGGKELIALGGIYGSNGLGSFLAVWIENADVALPCIVFLVGLVAWQRFSNGNPPQTSRG